MQELEKDLGNQLEDNMSEQNKGKKTQRTFSDGVAHILATFNNTIINIT